MNTAVPDPDPIQPGSGNEHLQEGNDMFRLLVEQVVDYAIFMLDPDGVVTTWNEGAQRIKGYKAPEIIGSHFSRFYQENDVRSGKPQLELELAARDGRFEDEGWRVRNDGSTFWANVVITALRDPSGKLRGFAKVTRDVTARREEDEHRAAAGAQEATRLRDHADRMAELERSKSDFLNLASHELRGPLTVVRGYISMLEDGDLSAQDLTAIAPIISAKIAQMELLIRQMLDTARLEHDRLALSLETFDLRTVAVEQVKDFKAIAGPRIVIDLDIGVEPVLVRGDRARIATVAGNLIDNAIKYSISGGAVRVIVSARDEHAFLTIEDHGIGIAKDDLELLFKRFSRLDTEANRTVSGTGLGLFLSREIAHRHGGEILVESRQGVGSRFSLSLPRMTRSNPIALQ